MFRKFKKLKQVSLTLLGLAFIGGLSIACFQKQSGRERVKAEDVEIYYNGSFYYTDPTNGVDFTLNVNQIDFIGNSEFTNGEAVLTLSDGNGTYTANMESVSISPVPENESGNIYTGYISGNLTPQGSEVAHHYVEDIILTYTIEGGSQSDPEYEPGYNLIDYDQDSQTICYYYNENDISYPSYAKIYTDSYVVLDFRTTNSGTPESLAFYGAEIQGDILVGYNTIVGSDSAPLSIYLEGVETEEMGEPYEEAVHSEGWVLEDGGPVWQDAQGEHYTPTMLQDPAFTYVYKKCTATFSVEVDDTPYSMELTQAWIDTDSQIPQIHGLFSDFLNGPSTVVMNITVEVTYDYSYLSEGNLYYSCNSADPFIYYNQGKEVQTDGITFVSAFYEVVNAVPQISLVYSVEDSFSQETTDISVVLSYATYSSDNLGNYSIAGYSTTVHVEDNPVVLMVNELGGDLDSEIWAFNDGILSYIAPGGHVYRGDSLVYEEGMVYETYIGGTLGERNMSMAFSAGGTSVAFNLTDVEVNDGVVSGKNAEVYEGVISYTIPQDKTYGTYVSNYNIVVGQDGNYDNVFKCECVTEEGTTPFDIEEISVEYHDFPYGYDEMNYADLVFRIIELDKTISIRFTEAEVFSIDTIQYYIAGHFDQGDQDIEHDNGVKLSGTPITIEEEYAEPGWSYNSGDLIWTTSEHVSFTPTPVSGTYSRVTDKATITFAPIDLDSGEQETPVLPLTDCEVTPAEGDGYTVTGLHDADVMITTDRITIEVPSLEIEDYPQGWQYENGELSYADGNGYTYTTQYLNFTNASYHSKDVDTPYVDLTCTYSDMQTGETKEISLTLQSATYSRVIYEDTDYVDYRVSGYNTEITEDLITVATVLALETDEETPEPQPQPEPLESSWSYEEGYLYYSDPANNIVGGTYNSIAIYSEKNSTLSIAVALMDAETEESVGTKYISITSVEVKVIPQTADDYYVIEGYFNELASGQKVTLYLFDFSVETVPTEETKGDPITPEQETQIKSLLPETEDTRASDILESGEITQGTAAEIYNAVSDTKAQIDDKRQADPSYTVEEYQKDLSTIQTITEAAVVVGAGADVAEEKGQAINDVLPEGSGIVDMSQALDDFYQTQMNYLLGKEVVPDKKDTTKAHVRVTRTEPSADPGIDLNVEEYDLMIEFVDTSVENVEEAALAVRKCSGGPMKANINAYIEMVLGECFRDYDKQKADKEFVEQAHESIMLTMQQQVIEALEKDHKPSNDPQKEAEYQEELEAVKDLDTFKEIVMEVLRLKYVSLTNEEIDIDSFREIYWNIFKAWALDDPSLNPYGITLEELTNATIETTTKRANRMTFTGQLQTEEIIFLSVVGGVTLAGVGAGIAVPMFLKKKKGVLAK